MTTSPRPSSALSAHIPGLDGLRGVAMAVVVVYHSDLGAKGAFLALSQFFTLSGFLIMSIVLRRMEGDGNVDLKRFWGDRYRRLLPASMFTLAMVVVAGFTIATASQTEHIRDGLWAAVAQVANWHFVFTEQSYVDLFSSPSPIQHFWSLAVEEQFYVAMPLVAVGVHRLFRSIGPIFAVFTVLALASTAWTWWLLDHGASIDRLYYGTDTRAAEMLVGCLLAIVIHWRPVPTAGRARTALVTAGLVAYGLSFWAFAYLPLNEPANFRGGLLIFSLLSAVVIASICTASGPLNAVLSWRPLAHMGRLVYAIYLFHWPILLFFDAERVGLDGWALLGVQAPVVLVLAELSARFLENPIRYRRARPGDLRVPGGIVLAGLLLLAGGWALKFNDTEVNLAGVGEATEPAPDIIATGPTRVLVIADNAGSGVADEIGEEAEVEIVGSIPFGCGSETDPDLCRATISSWHERAHEVSADVVLIHASEWPADTLEALAGSDDLADQTAWLTSTFADGVDGLVAEGIGGAWGWSTGALDREGHTSPFFVSVFEITTRSRTFLRVGDLTNSQIAQRLDLVNRADEGARRVMIVGDSVSLTIGYGLEIWADETGNAVVWTAGTEGCGMANDGRLPAFFQGGVEEVSEICRSVASGWADQVERFDPDIVLVVTSAVDTTPRQLDEWDDFLEPGDPEFDAYLIDAYASAYDTLSAGGAAVVWLTSPCPESSGDVAESRTRYLNDLVLPAVADARPTLRSFDLEAKLCTDGAPLLETPDGDALRYDPLHFSPAGSEWIADQWAAEMLDLG